MKLYTRDYLDHKELRRCSHVARSIWADLICLMAEGSPIGYLSDKFGPLETAFVASRIIAKESDVKKAIAELIEKHVAKVDDNGVLYSPKMVHDEEVRLRRAYGGTASICNPNVPRKKDILNGHPQRISFDSSEGYPHRANFGNEVRTPLIASDSDSGSEISESKGCDSQNLPDYDELLNRWPPKNRRGVDLGGQYFVDLIDSKEITASNWGDVLDGLERWKASESWQKDGGKYIPGIGKWLQQRAWKDEPKPAEGEAW